MAMAVLITTQVLTEGRFLTEAIIITIVSFFAYGAVVSSEVRMALTLVLFFKRGTFWRLSTLYRTDDVTLARGCTDFQIF